MKCMVSKQMTAEYNKNRWNLVFETVQMLVHADC
jgi:hypothetical protein